jgi:hypothetical protein
MTLKYEDASMLKPKIHFEKLGIISGNSKRLLECYVDTRLFSQHKCYDEWYITDCTSPSELGLDLRCLFTLSDRFEIRVVRDGIEIEERC